MKIDKYGALVYENSSVYGNIGEAMAETARLHRMLCKIGIKEILKPEWCDILESLKLDIFRTDKGWLRHPDAPFADEKGVSWRETDTTGDMELPWFLEATPAQRAEMKWRTFRNGLRYGNGTFIHPGFFAEITNWDWLKTNACNSQLDLFSLKYRWSDRDGLKWYNHFEPVENSAADYLNFNMVLCERPDWLRNRVRAQTMNEKYTSYYGWDANKDWFLEIAYKFNGLYLN